MVPVRLFLLTTFTIAFSLLTLKIFCLVELENSTLIIDSPLIAN